MEYKYTSRSIDDTMEFVNIVTILELGLRLAVEKLVR